MDHGRQFQILQLCLQKSFKNYKGLLSFRKFTDLFPFSIFRVEAKVLKYMMEISAQFWQNASKVLLAYRPFTVSRQYKECR